MKKIFALLGLVFAIITFCMIYLVRKGVSLRSEPLIRPTVISADQRNIASHTVLRIFPDLQNNDYILWGVLPESPDTQLLMTHFLEEYFKKLQIPPHIIQDGTKASPEEIKNCAKPCWVKMPHDQANTLAGNSLIEEKIIPTHKNYLTLTVMPFNGDETVSEFCDQQKRLTLECITPVSVREIHRKMKDPKQLYFFLRKYNERDFFLFVQKELPKNAL
ncbi:hypothetical protein B9G69_006885 [Bdellovibrio sp. SKB1291214]|uniref:hypothetical protein n=1 Tax=Bdellovibrio sp. SKB1291214 TaxID=1732569 RepID=UPI000B51C934|nr:hypothetical protein [Bdellovibrio sp. SKB1291214]UYL10303.1 hypothetical protein B9G69_006885 [Bdellovibrio sp. SKB1291214]